MGDLNPFKFWFDSPLSEKQATRRVRFFGIDMVKGDVQAIGAALIIGATVLAFVLAVI